MEDTVFDKIIRREIPAEIVYEDEYTLAFLDQMPNVPGHTLVIPKKPIRNIFDVDADTFAHIMETVRMLAPKIRDAMGASGMQIVMNNEPAGGQAVFHMHVHLAPHGDTNPIAPEHKAKANPEELALVAEKIRAVISA